MANLKFILFLILIGQGLYAQPDFYDNLKVSKTDSLRGQLQPERTCFDVLHYDLSLELLIEEKAIVGQVKISYKVQEDFNRLQIDLFKNMIVDSILYQNSMLKYERIENAIFIYFDSLQRKGTTDAFSVYYHGQPIIAKNPPWDGGFSWDKDAAGNDWIVVNCEGIGASLWWPNKDHLSDEPDSADIRITIPEDLFAVSNGILKEELKIKNKRKRFHWQVSYPINNYNITLAVGKYAHFKEYYISPKGDSLDLDYYVLEPNLEKAKKHFKMVPEMLGVYESFLGPYPFWKDGYALVETPSLGMEHQGAISYGNQFKKGYLGGRIPKGMDWDFIIVHESAHEYWGNSVSCNDLAEMWLHEGFTTYMEALYVEELFGYDRAIEYLMMQKNYIRNTMPIEGKMDINFSHMVSTDQYYKGSWILHSLRNVIGDDEKWFGLLKAYYHKYAFSNVTTQDFVHFVNEYTGKNFNSFFEQYLIFKNPPKLIYSVEKTRRKLVVRYKWETDVPNFEMPIGMGCKGHFTQVIPSSEKWQTITFRKMKKRKFKIEETKAYFLMEERNFLR